MLDPCLFDRLVACDSKLSLDALDYIEECHQIMIGLQQQLIDRTNELIATRERATYLNNKLKVSHDGIAQEVPAQFGCIVLIQ